MHFTLSRNLTHGELFAGISGFGLGFARAGIKTLWHVEIDKHCQSILRRHYSGNLILSDIRDCGGRNLPAVNIISFGSPCQGLSIAGQRKGLNDDRSGLFFEAIRVVGELKPDFAIWENVPGATSSNFGRDFAAVLSEFRRIGARDIAWRTLDSQYFGVPQRRRRIFLVADFRGESAAEILFEPESSPWDSPPGREAGSGIAGNTQAGVGIGGEEIGFSLRIAFQQNTRDEVRLMNGDGQIVGALASQPGMKQQNYVAFGGNNTSGPVSIATRCNAHPTRRYDFESETFVLYGGEKRKDRPEGGFYVKNEKVAKTLDQSGLNPNVQQGGVVICNAFNGYTGGADDNDAQGNHLVIAPTLSAKNEVASSSTQRAAWYKQSAEMFGAVRRLTPLECERLQGFPDGWTEDQSDTQRYRQLGNAVTVSVAEWLAHRIVEASGLLGGAA